MNAPSSLSHIPCPINGGPIVQQPRPVLLLAREQVVRVHVAAAAVGAEGFADTLSEKPHEYSDT